MTRFHASILVATSLWLGACGGGETAEEGNGTPGVDDETGDTATGGIPVVNLEPVAIGIEIETGMTSAGQLSYFMFGAGPDVYPTYLVLTVTDLEYFSLASDNPDRQLHGCEFIASFPHVVSTAPPLAKGFDYESGSGSTSENIALWFFAEGSAEIYSNAIYVDEDGQAILDEDGDYVDTPACASLKEQGYPDIIDGMHVGIGFGEMSTYLYEEVWGSFEDPDLAAIEANLSGMYVAINHPNPSAPEGYDFIPYDWNSAVYFEAMIESIDLYDDGGTFSAEVAMATLTPESTLVYTTPMSDAYVRGFANWYEDYPNLDLSLLKEGVPDIP